MDARDMSCTGCNRHRRGGGWLWLLLLSGLVDALLGGAVHAAARGVGAVPLDRLPLQDFLPEHPVDLALLNDDLADAANLPADGALHRIRVEQDRGEHVPAGGVLAVAVLDHGALR